MSGCRRTPPTGTGGSAPELGAWPTVKEQAQRAVEMDRPNAARMYEYYLGTCHNFAVDRHAAQAAIAAAPRIVATARANRDFARRALRYALDEGVAQFLDLGAGIPVNGATHEVVRPTLPAAPVVYIDDDPVVATMACEIIAADPACAVIRSDIRDLATILDAPYTRGQIDFTRPVCALLTAVLHYLPGDLTDIMSALRTHLCAGSLLVISHDAEPDAEHAARAAAVREIYAQTTTPLTLRRPEQIATLLTGFDLIAPDHPESTVPPALVPVDGWRPDRDQVPADGSVPDAPLGGLLAGVGRKPPHRTSTSRPPKPTNRMPTDVTNPTNTRQRTPRRTLAVPAAALAVVAIAAIPAATVSATPRDAATSAVAARPTPTTSARPASTADQLRALAATIRDSPADQQTGPYTCHHLRHWILDTTGTPARRPSTPAVFRIDLRRWDATDGSGLGIDTELPPAYDLTVATPTHRTTDNEFANAPVTRNRYRAGSLSSPITGPQAVDTTALARQLAYDPLPDGPQATLRAIDELYTNGYVTLPTQVAILRVLATISGLRFQPAVPDRLGRRGFAVSLDAATEAGPLRFTLTFDRATAQLLASSQQLIGPATDPAVPDGLVTYSRCSSTRGTAPALPRTWDNHR